MTCTPIALEGAEYCDNLEKENGGLRDTLTIWQHQDVQTYPTYTTAAGENGVEPTASEGSITASTGFTMKSTKKPLKFQTILEKNALTVTSEGTIFNTELKCRIQDNTHNRGLMGNMIKARFSIAFQEDAGQVRLIGQSNGISTGYLATVKKGSYKEEVQEALTGERFIEFIVTARRYQPVNYNTSIVY